MAQPIKDKVVIITGASSGIGKACAYTFGEAGAKLVIAARNTEKLKVTADELRNKGIEVVHIPTDVSKENEVKHLIESSIDHFGQLDILINNAGISMRALFKDLQLEVFKKVMDINFRGTVYCTKYALPHLLKSKGSVVGISSVAGYKGLPGRSAYSASKFAMQGFLESLRIENKKTGLHVLITYPGFTASNIRKSALQADGSQQGESPRKEQNLMQAEEVAEKVLSAVQSKKRTLILGRKGRMLAILNKFFPSMTDHLVFRHFAKEPDAPF